VCSIFSIAESRIAFVSHGGVWLVSLQSDDAGAALAAAMLGASGAKSETRGNGPAPGGGGLMEEMSALLARR